jgi:serine/threonine protein kinase
LSLSAARKYLRAAGKYLCAAQHQEFRNEFQIPMPRLSRAFLSQTPRRSLHRARNWSKAEVYEVEWPPASGRAVVVKDLKPLPAWFKLLAGRALLRREARALRALKSVDGVPDLVARVDADAIAMEKTPGQPLPEWLREAREGPEREAALLRAIERVEELQARFHDRGVTHGDLHSDNILVDEKGNVALIDWATAGVFGPRPSGAKKWSFEEWRALDERALAKLKVLHAPDLVSPRERDLLVGGGSRLYRGVKSLRRLLDRARGKQSGKRSGVLQRYIAQVRGEGDAAAE